MCFEVTGETMRCRNDLAMPVYLMAMLLTMNPVAARGQSQPDKEDTETIIQQTLNAAARELRWGRDPTLRGPKITRVPRGYKMEGGHRMDPSFHEYGCGLAIRVFNTHEEALAEFKRRSPFLFNYSQTSVADDRLKIESTKFHGQTARWIMNKHTYIDGKDGIVPTYQFDWIRDRFICSATSVYRPLALSPKDREWTSERAETLYKHVEESGLLGFPVSGVVRNWKDGSPIPQVPLRYFEGDYQRNIIPFTTDENGQFSFLATRQGKLCIIYYAFTNPKYLFYRKVFAAPTDNALITLVPLDAVGDDKPEPLVLTHDGDVEYVESGGSQWKPLTEGMAIPVGATVRALDNGSAVVVIPNKGLIHLQPMSQFRYARKDKPRTLFDLIRGILCIHKIPESEPFELKTSAGFAGGRGTLFRCKVDENGDTVDVLHGTVEVRPNASPQKPIIVQTSQRLTIHGDETSLVQLSDGDLEELAKALRRVDWDSRSASVDVSPPQIAQVPRGAFPNWTDDGSGCWSATETGYLFKGKKQDGLRYAHFGLPMQDCVVEMEVRKTAGDSKKSKWGYGLYVRSDGRQQNYYEFVIQSGGQFQIGKGSGGKFMKLASFSKSDALKTGHGEWNTLKVTAMGSVLCFYANGQLLRKLSDDSIAAGKIGLFAVDAYDSEQPDTVEFRNVRVMKP